MSKSSFNRKRHPEPRRTVVRWRGGDAPSPMVRRVSENPRPARMEPYKLSPERRRSIPFNIFPTLAALTLFVTLCVGLYFLLTFLWSYFTTGNVAERTATRPVELAGDELALPKTNPLRTSKVVHRVVKGETPSKIAEQFAAANLSQALTSAKSPSGEGFKLRTGEELIISLDNRGVAELSTSGRREGEVRLVRQRNDSYAVRITEMPRVTREQLLVGSIQTSFAAAAYEVGTPYDIVDELVDLFSDRIRFHQDFQKGDRFTVIFRNEVLADGTSVSAGPILAAELEVGGKRLVAVRYVGTDGKARHFDGTGNLLGETFLRYPLKFSRISSYFTTARFHPVLKIKRPHNGVDFAAPVGTPVRTIADGKVEFAGRRGGSGIMVKIDHNDRYSTAYLHLSKIASGVRSGARVTKGQLIGAVGQTGLATGPHLHFSFYDRGKYVDPLKIDLPTLESLSKGMMINARYLKKALFTLEHYQQVELGAVYR